MITFITILLLLGVYPYIIYPIVGVVIVAVKSIIQRFIDTSQKVQPSDEPPTVTLLIAAYNEEDHILEKITNTLRLNYPQEKLKVVFITDGSSDQTPNLVAQYQQFQLLHEPERKGKMHALRRAMNYIKTEIVVFCDANTQLNPDAIHHIVEAFKDPKVGCVAGRKIVLSDRIDTAAPAGEGFYWKFESFLKWIDDQIYTTVGAVGELFALRRELYEPVPEDTILDDMCLSLSVIRKGFRIKYEPRAVAAEYGSVNVAEEMKRKIRIAAGGFQIVSRNFWIFNIFNHPWASFQFISHKFMRWSITPIVMVLLPIFTLLAYVQHPDNTYLQILCILQSLFFLLVLLGYLLRNLPIKSKPVFFAYYFFVANMSQFLGFARFMRGKSTVKWERATRINKSRIL